MNIRYNSPRLTVSAKKKQRRLANSDIENNEHCYLSFSDEFRLLKGKKKYKIIKKIFRFLAEHDDITGVVMEFVILNSEPDSKWLMRKLDRKGYTWFQEDERLKGIDEGLGIIYWFSVDPDSLIF